MARGIKNIIFLTVDSMRYDRLPCGGYPIRTTPTIESLMKNGISCSNAFTHSHPTQFSFPSIFTSTLPLDFGGYDAGIKERPVTLAQVLKNNGYRTAAFSTSIFLSRFFGYERGFDEFYEIFDIKLFWETLAGIYCQYYKRLKENKTIEENEFRGITKTILNGLFRYALPFCEEKRGELLLGKLQYDKRVYRHNFQLLRKLLQEKLNQLDAEPHGYLLECLDQISYKDLYTFVGLPKNTAKKARALCDSAIRKVLRMFSVQVSGGGSNINAEYLKKAITNWIGNNSGKPFYLWAHFLDVHDLNCISGKVGFPPGYREVHAGRVRLGRKYHGNFQYDLALRYVDENIRGIVGFLKDNELLNETLIVISSDHGAHNAGRPNRVFSHIPVGEGYEEVLKIPMIFHNANFKQHVTRNLCTTLDIAPTILDLAGIGPVNEFMGHSVCSSAAEERTYIICENLSSGPCDLERKPINIAVRTKQYKYIFREFCDRRETVPRGLRELYDLNGDPEEKNNISGVKAYDEIEKYLENIARKRCAEIRERRV
ncbi:MAG: sulfatase [Candidatus Omnitrophota bacterium]